MSLAVVIHAPRDLRLEETEVPALGPRDVEVRVGAGGICGSDLHYYQDGGFGTVRIKEPMVLGHEVAGTVAAVGEAVRKVRPGDKVAVNPSRPCNACRYCLEGLPRHCLNMLFYGSAMRFPHVQGGFRQRLVAEERQCVPVPADLPLEKAAFGEPLAVCLHAVNRAGPLLGKKVLITGAGPIGMLTLLAARNAGAAEVVITDVADAPLALAKRIGADEAVNVARQGETMKRFHADKGHFDVMFEASGNPAALRQGIECVRPAAVVVLIGIGGEASLMLNVLVAKEVDLRGTFRFDKEFDWAVEAIAKGRIDPSPLLTDVMPVRDAVKAFEHAADRSKAMKVQLSFD
jgi:L-idonate 5-dehydrogenase